MPPNPQPSGAARAVASATSLSETQVQTVLELLQEGATVPFIARYRKERTGALDEVQLFAIAREHARYLDVEARRANVIEALRALEVLTPERLRQLENATTLSAIEDIWWPFRKKRRTRATIAREAGLEPLAMMLLEQVRGRTPEDAARAFVAPERGVADIAQALAGAVDIAAEVVADDPTARRTLREALWRHAALVTQPSRQASPELRERFASVLTLRDRPERVPSHRMLAMFRAETEGAVRLSFELDEARLLDGLKRIFRVDPRSPFAPLLERAIADSRTRLLGPSVETEVRHELKRRADAGAIAVFARNLEALLLAPPLGAVPLIGIDPGLRTGAKVVALSSTGELLAHATIFPLTDPSRAGAMLLDLISRYRAEAVAIGHGTGGRETITFVRERLATSKLKEVRLITVNESGASIYSASDVAREEFPDLDLTWRGAISIGRRLQDPLAELVKLDPQTLGVGQYQHDVDQGLLRQCLDEVVETAVNRVGVDVNLASPHLLRRIAGLGPALAQAIVQHRRTHGPFRSRRDLKDVRGLGPTRFQQCAGFLRVRGGDDPLDASAVHPERYGLVARMASDMGVSLAALVGNEAASERIDPARYFEDGVGEPTLRDIVEELKRPGRDPRIAFDIPQFRDDVRALTDLKRDMVLEGVVTNVTAFGAFIDIGVHCDGLVHISMMSDGFVRDPHEVVNPGRIVRVRVVDVDIERQRIALSMKGLAQA